MKIIVTTTLLVMSIALAGCASPSIAPVQSKGITKEQAVGVAQQKGREMNVPVDKRTPTVENKGECFVVEFAPPPNARAGKWVFNVDKSTGKVVDAKVWR